MGRLQGFPYTVEPPRRILLACHRHADVDAYCAAFGLYHLFKRLYRGTRIHVATPEGLSVPARALADRLKMKTLGEPPAGATYDLLVAVDTGNTDLLKGWLPLFQGSRGRTLLIDHHPLRGDSRRLFRRTIVDVDASSSSEIVARIWLEKGLSPTPRVASALLAGIYTDSRSFTAVGCRTLAVIHRLCEAGGSVDWVREVLSLPRDPSEAMARLKAAQRMALTRISKWVLATSLVGAFQASAAKALVDLGADVAAVVGESEGQTKGSLRSTEAFYRETGIHLGNDVVAKLLEAAGGGSGGGHPTAASFQVTLPPEDCRKRLVSILEGLARARARGGEAPTGLAGEA